MIGSTATDAKWLCVFIGLALSIAALAGRFIPRKAE
jgi:hypothetical protein